MHRYIGTPGGGILEVETRRWYNLGVASLPIGPVRDQQALERRQRAQLKLALAIIDAEGDWRGVADRLAKGDEAEAAKWRMRMRRWIDEDYFQSLISRLATGELRLGLPATVQAVNRRAAKGNIPAAKLAMESSGFWSPRHEHRHSGRIEIELKGVPRPEPAVDISEADVVED
jgi:hypothetical protein